MSRNNTSYLKRLYTCPSTQTSSSSKYYPNSTDEKHASKKDVLQMTENPSQSGLRNERYVSFCVCCVCACVCVRACVCMFWLTELKGPELEIAFSVA